ISWRRVRSRASVPTAPRKYFVVTMVEALTDQKSGYSTARCSKTVSPVFQLVCTTSRCSHVTSSYGCTPGVVKMRSIVSPVRTTWGFASLVVVEAFAVSLMCSSSVRGGCEGSGAVPVVLAVLVVLLRSDHGSQDEEESGRIAGDQGGPGSPVV